MCHAWQAMQGFDFWRHDTLSWQVQTEQEADGVSKQILRNIFNHYAAPADWSYFDIRDIRWLAGYYDGWVEDDLGVLTLS